MSLGRGGYAFEYISSGRTASVKVIQRIFLFVSEEKSMSQIFNS